MEAELMGLPYLDRVRAADTGIYFCRTWIDYSTGVVLFTRLNSECYHFGVIEERAEYQGEVTEQSVLHDEVFDCTQLDTLLESMLANGILGLSSDVKPGIVTDYTDFVYIRPAPGQEHWYWIGMGEHPDDRHNTHIRAFFEGPLGLGPFFDAIMAREAARGKRRLRVRKR